MKNVSTHVLEMVLFVAISRGHAMTELSSSQGGFSGGDESLRFLRLTDAHEKTVNVEHDRTADTMEPNDIWFVTFEYSGISCDIWVA